MNTIDLLRDLDRDVERYIKSLDKTNIFKRYVIIRNLRSALVHVKRELRKEVWR